MRHIQYAVFVLFVVAALLSGCAAESTYPRVSLAEEGPAPAPTWNDVEASPALRVAIAAVISPRSTVQSYTPFLDYLGQRLGRPIQLVQGRTYQEVNSLLRDRAVDLALVCSGAYVQGHRDFGMEILVAPEVDGQTVYYSYVIVPAGSPAQSMADLRGKTFAFTDPMSNSGWLMPVYMLWQMRETPERFFDHTIYTYSHDNSIRAVADGLVNGAAVDSLVYTYALNQQPELADRVRVIGRSGPNAIPPVVVHPALDTLQKEVLKDVLLTMHQDEAGRAALAPLMIDRFVTIQDSAYDSVREAEAKVRGTS